MPTYISLLRWTQKGVENIKEGPARLDKAKEVLKSVGGELKGCFLTLGAYDMVVRFDVPDDTAAAKFMLAVASRGTIQSQTMRAFSEEEYRKIVASL